MIASQHEESDLIGGKLDDMKKAREKMLQGWDEKKKEYDQCMELQLFNRDIEQMESIMVVQEVHTFSYALLHDIKAMNKFLDPPCRSAGLL